MGLCDDSHFLWMLVWEKAHHGDKAGRPGAMIDLVKLIVQRLARFPYFRLPYSGVTQPFVLYLDSRFCSIEALELINGKNMYMVGSNSVSRRPTKLWPYLKQDLEKREWRTVFWEDQNAVVCVVRAKKRAYVNLVSNYVGDHPQTITHIRRKHPRSSYKVATPQVQKEYNLHKNNVDLFNKMILAYRQRTNYVSEGQVLLHFFVNATLVNAFIWFKRAHNPGLSHLNFRLQLLVSLKKVLFPQASLVRAPQPGSNNHAVRPLSANEKLIRKCPVRACQRHPWRFCVGCGKVLCSDCYDRLHSQYFGAE